MKKGAEKLPAFGSRNQGHGHTRLANAYIEVYTKLEQDITWRY